MSDIQLFGGPLDGMEVSDRSEWLVPEVEEEPWTLSAIMSLDPPLVRIKRYTRAYRHGKPVLVWEGIEHIVKKQP